MAETAWAASGPGSVRPVRICCSCIGGEFWGGISLQIQVPRVRSAETRGQVKLGVKTHQLSVL